MVDYATSYHLLRLVPTRSGKEVAALFAEAWIGTFEAPKELVYDQGSKFRTDFDELLEQCGTLSTVITVETHWHGAVERNGSTAKTIARNLIDTHTVLTTEGFRWVL